MATSLKQDIPILSDRQSEHGPTDNPLLVDSTTMKKPARHSNHKASKENHLMSPNANTVTQTKTRPSRENVLKPFGGNQSKTAIEKAPKRKQVTFIKCFMLPPPQPQLPWGGRGVIEQTRKMGKIFSKGPGIG